MKSLSKLSRKQTSRLAGRRPAQELQLIREWLDIVGPQVAAWCRPNRLILDRSKEPPTATLELRVQSAFVLEVQQSHEQIRGRLNRYFGYQMLDSLRVKQTRQPFPKLRATQTRVEDVKTLDVDLADLPDTPPDDPELAARLARLQKLIKQKST